VIGYTAYLDLISGEHTAALDGFAHLEADPEFAADADFGAGSAWATLGLYEQGRDCFARALKAAPNDAFAFDCRYALARTLELLGENEEAVEQYQTLYTLNPGYGRLAANGEGDGVPTAGRLEREWLGFLDTLTETDAEPTSN
jgi:tetratricopeptide (TPR) repeat protein